MKKMFIAQFAILAIATVLLTSCDNNGHLLGDKHESKESVAQIEEQKSDSISHFQEFEKKNFPKVISGSFSFGNNPDEFTPDINFEVERDMQNGGVIDITFSPTFSNLWIDTISKMLNIIKTEYPNESWATTVNGDFKVGSRIVHGKTTNTDEKYAQTFTKMAIIERFSTIAKKAHWQVIFNLAHTAS